MTPIECFTFALKMTSNGISNKEINDRVEAMIDKLRLNNCRKTLIGGTLMKGVSGGERKRTSIGYELIKNPSILMLDEPTSGLDSFTALEIAKILKIEAYRGMTVISTIHCPSSAVLEKFDHLLILADGYTIFSAPPREIRMYFLRYDLELPAYKNPADTLMKLANNPESFGENFSIQGLAHNLNNKFVMPDGNI